MRSSKMGAWAARVLIALVTTTELLALSGCASDRTPSLEPKPVKLARTQKVAVIRLGNPKIQEPSDADIADGIRHAGVDASSYTLVDRDAKGDPAAVPSLIDAAIGDGADLLMTLVPETTLAATAKDRKVPLVFYMVGEPIALGLGQSDTEHRADLTGVYTSFRASLLVPIARGCLPKGHKLGIPFNPDDRLSVVHKDALLKEGWDQFEPVTAEFHSESEVPAAIRALVEKKADGILLVTGIGEAARAAIAEARRAKVPVFGFRADHARAGAIVAKEPVMRQRGFDAGRRAGRILKGEKPGRIPFGKGGSHVLYVNTGEIKGLGLTPFGALMRSAEVVSTE